MNDDDRSSQEDGAPVKVSDAVVEPPHTGTLSAERIAAKSLEARLLGGERKLRRREVAAGAGLSLLSARKLWRALGFPNWVTTTLPSPSATRPP